MQINLDYSLQALTSPSKTRQSKPDKPLALSLPTSHTVRIGLLLMTVLILNAVDLTFTLFAYRIQEMTELNPLADTFFALGRTNSLICFKLLMVGCGCGMLWRLRHSRWALPGCWVLLVVYTGLALVWLSWVQHVNYSYETIMVTGTPLRELIH